MTSIEIRVLAPAGIEDYHAHLLRLDASHRRACFANEADDRGIDGHCLKLLGRQAIMIGGYVVIPAGTPAVGEVTWVTGRGVFGKSGKMNIAIHYIDLNGRHIPVEGTFRQDGEGNTVATLVGTAIVPVAGLFITGRSAVIPAGRQLTVRLVSNLPVILPPGATVTPAPVQLVRPALAPAAPLKIGFAQTGAESAWRTANSESMKAEAAKRGIDLKFSDGQGRQENQIRALRSFIAQRVDAIVLAPLVETGWDPVLRDAKRAGIPVIITDRSIQTADESLYACFIGSDFFEEGRMAAEWLAKKTGGKGRIVELQGTPGSAPANDRRKAFAEGIAKYPGLQVIDSQSGDFRRTGGKEVMEAFLKKHGKTIDIVYAHNDDMALGAIQAIEEAGLKPGTDIVIVSIDAVREGVQAVADGRINCTVECNPLFGPKVYDTVAAVLAGKKVERKSYNKDELFDATNAATALPKRQY